MHCFSLDTKDQDGAILLREFDQIVVVLNGNNWCIALYHDLTLSSLFQGLQYIGHEQMHSMAPIFNAQLSQPNLNMYVFSDVVRKHPAMSVSSVIKVTVAPSLASCSAITLAK